MKFTFFKQQDSKDCGPTCLRMICKHYGRNVPIQKLRSLCYVNKSGTTLYDVSEAAEMLGFRTRGARLTIEQLTKCELPCIVHWHQSHFVVLYRVKKRIFFVADPSGGLRKLSESDFKNNWFSHKEIQSGICMLLSPTPSFSEGMSSEDNNVTSWSSILQYFKTYRQLFIQLIIALGASTLFSLITPFLTQAIVDIGVNTRNLDFVYLILIAQIMLFVGSTSVNFIRSWILLHVSTRINLSILTDFLIKLMRLPLSFFETKTTGDIMQRMNDQKTIENFLTSTALNAFFSIINLVLFTIILAYYNLPIFFVSLACTALYTGWILLFLKRRRALNYRQFENAAGNQNSIVELVSGMQEIKLNNCERQKRWSWEHIQAQLFKYKTQTLSLTQYQQGGSIFINQSKNILVTFLSVKAVIDGQITLGGMMAIQYIVGQVSNPVEQLLGFIQSYQDAKISLERLGEIHQLDDEEPQERYWMPELPPIKTISIHNLTFAYPGAGNAPVLENISMIIPAGKTTAIVGKSGSGKTTLLKLLLRFYEPRDGNIKVGMTNLNQIAFKPWREACGTVLQDGFIFSDTIQSNIAVGSDYPEHERLQHAVKVANIEDYIAEQPFGLFTQIGSGGSGISQGQKQRLLIARAVYKNPDYLFFDEATNALDSNNERIIMENLSEFLKGKTVVVVAHRLSTVSGADNIIVLDKGKIIEQGSHSELVKCKGEYYTLVKNQLELGT